MSPLHRIDVDGEMHGIIFEIQLNPATPPGKILGVPYHQRAGSFQSVENAERYLFSALLTKAIWQIVKSSELLTRRITISC